MCQILEAALKIMHVLIEFCLGLVNNCTNELNSLIALPRCYAQIIILTIPTQLTWKCVERVFLLLLFIGSLIF